MEGAASVQDLAQTVLHLQSALVAVMDETEAVKANLMADNAKLQREFRETVDVLLAQQQSTSVDTSSGVNASLAILQDKVMHRMDSIEGAVTDLQQKSLVDRETPVANAEAIHHTKLFINKAELELSSFKRDMASRIESLESQAMQAASDSSEREVSFNKQLSQYKEEQQRLQVDHFQRITETIRGSSEASGSGSEGTLASSAKLLSHVEEMVAAEVLKQVQPQLRQQKSETGSMVEVVTARQEQLIQQVDAVDELSKQLHARMKEMTIESNGERTASSAIAECKAHSIEVITSRLRSLQEDWNSRNAQMMVEIDQFVREYVNAELSGEGHDNVEGGAKKDGKSSPRAPGRTTTMRDVIASSSFSTLQDEVAALSARLDSAIEETARLNGATATASHNALRVEQSVENLKHKIEVDLKSEFSRADQQQRAFFQRQEQLLDSERQSMTMKVSTEVAMLRQQHDDSVAKAEQRRNEEYQTAREILQRDFERTAAMLREELNTSTKLLNERCDKAATAAMENAMRVVTGHIDTNKRAQQSTFEDVRRISSRNADEVQRLKQQVDENSSRLQEQHGYLHSRLQQILEDELQRIDRITDDITLRLNSQVENEVKRVVGASEAQLRRELEKQAENSNRELKAVRDEISSIRNSLHAISAPSVVVDSLEKRVEVQRQDLINITDAIAKLSDNDVIKDQKMLVEVRGMIDQSRNDIVREVGTQLQRFDVALLEISREQQNARPLQQSVSSDPFQSSSAPGTPRMGGSRALFPNQSTIDPYEAAAANVSAADESHLGGRVPAAMATSAGRSISIPHRSDLQQQSIQPDLTYASNLTSPVPPHGSVARQQQQQHFSVPSKANVMVSPVADTDLLLGAFDNSASP